MLSMRVEPPNTDIGWRVIYNDSLGQHVVTIKTNRDLDRSVFSSDTSSLWILRSLGKLAVLGDCQLANAGIKTLKRIPKSLTLLAG